MTILKLRTRIESSFGIFILLFQILCAVKNI